MRNSTGSSIPQFGLYGESAVDDPSFIHIENIESRSSVNGWEIKPHRHGKMFQLLLMYAGAVEVRLDTQLYRRESCCGILVPAGVVHGFTFAPDTEGVVLSLAEPLVKTEAYLRSQPYFEPLFAGPQIIDFDAPDSLIEDLRELIGQIERELTRPDTGRALMSEWLAQAVLMTLRRQYDRGTDTGTQKRSERREMLSYRNLIELHYKAHWTVEQYATRLGMTVDRLNRLCKTESGQTAKALVQERLLLEAKRRLIYTRGSQDEIAYGLGFKDAAYFSRFFKRHTGQTPGQFRSVHNLDTQTEVTE